MQNFALNKSKSFLKKLPLEPGIYIFKKGSKPIYVGKSKLLKNRVSSYFSKAVTGKTRKMVNSSNKLSIVKVNSEFEALLLEANLISKFKPKYNVIQKDDKTPLYIKITNEKLPRVLLVRRGELSKKDTVFGPFQSKKTANFIISQARRIFPFSTHKIGKKPCIYSQLGLCSPCPNLITNERLPQETAKKLTSEYKANIRSLKSLLKGDFEKLRFLLFKKLKNYSKLEEFEKANELKKKIESLDNLSIKKVPLENYLTNPNLFEEIRKNELDSLKSELINYFKINTLERIECFDIAHIQGQFTSASMVVFIKGSAVNSLYRQFKIKTSKKASDTDSLYEVAKRRRKNINNWGRANLIVVDGGKGQVSKFSEAFGEKKPPIIGFSKENENLVIKKGDKFINIQTRNKVYYPLIKRMINEAHRFARRYHHTLLKKSLLGKNK